jgi:hypothetical protein
VRELSTAMTRACADAVDVEIETWLRKICNALDLDRAAILSTVGARRARAYNTPVAPSELSAVSAEL